MSANRPSRAVAVLPAFNESASIEQVVGSLLPYTSVIVVDDGSSDDTGDLARKAGADVVSHATNKGYEKALESGLRRALELEYEFAVTMDADGQHDSKVLECFITELSSGADLVIGKRDRMQRWAEVVFGLAARAKWGIHDPLCGMKGYRLDLLRRAGQFDTYSSVGTELTIRAARSGCEIRLLPVTTQNRSGSSRFGAGLRTNLRILRALLLGLLRAHSL